MNKLDLCNPLWVTSFVIKIQMSRFMLNFAFIYICFAICVLLYICFAPSFHSLFLDSESWFTGHLHMQQTKTGSACIHARWKNKNKILVQWGKATGLRTHQNRDWNWHPLGLYLLFCSFQFAHVPASNIVLNLFCTDCRSLFIKITTMESPQKVDSEIIVCN